MKKYSVYRSCNLGKSFTKLYIGLYNLGNNL